MSRRVVIGILLAVAGLGLAVFGVFVLMTMVRSSVSPAAALPTPQPELTQQVVVTRRDLALGSVLKAEDLALIDVPVEAAPLTVLTEVETAAGRMTRVPLVAGEMVMPHQLADPTNRNGDLAFILPEDRVLMAFPVVDLMTNLSLVKRGDLVDVLVSIEEPVEPQEVGAAVLSGEEGEKETRLFTFDAMQRIEITAVVADILREEEPAPAVDLAPGEEAPRPTPEPSPSEVKTHALLLSLSPQDALVLKHLKDSGAIFDFVLRNPNSKVTFETDPVMQEYLIDRYELEIKE